MFKKNNHNEGKMFIKKRKSVVFEMAFLMKPSGQNHRQSSLYECIFDNMALYFECRINSRINITHSFRLFFLAILPAGKLTAMIWTK